MKVLLKEDIDNLGYAGEVMSVADGYGRNFLIPQGKAVKATPSVLKQANVWRERAAVRMVELKKEHEALAARIAEVNLEFTARAGDTGKLYGSVTTADIVEQLNDSLGTEEIDRRSVIGDPLRQLGEHKVTIRLSRDYQPQLTVNIILFIEEEEIEEVEDEADEDSVEAIDEDGVVEDEAFLDSEESENQAEESVDEPSDAEESEDETSGADEAVDEGSEADEAVDEVSEAEETVDDLSVTEEVVDELSEAEESADAASVAEA